MQALIDDGLAIIVACLFIAALAAAFIVLRPWRRGIATAGATPTGPRSTCSLPSPPSRPPARMHKTQVIA
jgi:hypothetical protein